MPVHARNCTGVYGCQDLIHENTRTYVTPHVYGHVRKQPYAYRSVHKHTRTRTGVFMYK